MIFCFFSQAVRYPTRFEIGIIIDFYLLKPRRVLTMNAARVPDRPLYIEFTPITRREGK